MISATSLVDSRAGWRVVVGGGMVVAFGVPTLFGSTLGLFLKPMEADTGWTRSEIAFAFTLMTLLSPLAGPVFGWLIDRLPLRALMFAGIVLQTANIAAFSLVGGSPWSFYALCIGLMVTGGGASAMAMSKIVQGWFDRSLGRALGILFACIGIGAIVLPPVAQALISGVGWRHAYQALALLGLLIAGGAGWWLVRVRPDRDIDGKSSAAAKAAASGSPAAPSDHTPPASMWSMLRLRTWWVLAVWNALFAFAVGGIQFHFATMLQERGSTPAQSALALSLIGIGGMLGNLGSGLLLDRVSVRRMAVGLMLAPMLPVALLMGSTSAWVGMAAGLMFGLCGGADGILSHYLVRRFFGSAIYGQAFATQMVASSIGGGLAPWLAALIQQRTGSYQLVLMLAVAAFAVAAVVAAFFPRTDGAMNLSPVPASA